MNTRELEIKLTYGEILLAVIAAMLVCGLGGCGEEPIVVPTTAPQTVCAARDATYWVTYIQAEGGTCGDISEHAVTISGQPQRPAQCDFGKVVYSPDNCDVESVGIVCPMDAPPPQPPGATYTFNGKTRWLADGQGAWGRLTAVGRNASGGVLCESNYEIVYQISR